MKRLSRFLVLLGSAFFLCVATSYSQVNQDSLAALKRSAPKIFIDCPRCDIDYIKTEITFVNYVRERKEAQVHILVTTQWTGSGGREYTLTFIGQQNFSGLNDTLTYVSNQTDTEDEIRKGLVQVLKMGLMRYVAHTPVADQISISFKQQVKPTAVEDRWNYWVFGVNVHSFLSGEEAMNRISLFGSLYANRTTPDWKIRLSTNASYRENNFTIGDSRVSSFSRHYGFNGLIVRSISDHWSVGAFGSVSSSTYRNISLSLSCSPAIEYNLFPYSESTRKMLRFLYKLGTISRNYEEETIFDRTSETLFDEALSATLEAKQPWGSVETTLEGSHYFHDFSKYRLELYGEVSLRLWKGFSLNVFGSASMIRDQLSLPKRGATKEEILLRRRQLATSYDYFGSIGLQYTFGSIYSNVVNPRFGSYRMYY